jgi:Lrp/AsnC family leucine-responsive transcriptional regulator
MPAKTLLDELDIAILKELQSECRTPLQEIADRVGAPTSTVHYRLKRLEKTGIIGGYYAKLNSEKLDIDYIASIRISIDLSSAHYDEIGVKLAEIPGIWTVYLVLGDCDFLVLARSKNRDEFMKIIDMIMAIKGVRQLNTQIVAQLVKEDPRLDLDSFPQTI